MCVKVPTALPFCALSCLFLQSRQLTDRLVALQTTVAHLAELVATPLGSAIARRASVSHLSAPIIGANTPIHDPKELAAANRRRLLEFVLFFWLLLLL